MLKAFSYWLLWDEWEKMRCAHNVAPTHFAMPAATDCQLPFNCSLRAFQMHCHIKVYIRLTLPDIVKRRAEHFTTEQFKSQFEHKDRGIFLKMSSNESSHQEGSHLTAINA